MAKRFLLKLKCGSKTLDLNDESTVFMRQDTFIDNGETVEATLVVKKDASQDVATFLHDLAWFNHKAIEYEQGKYATPVRLGCKYWDGNDYDTTFGRGWGWKTLTGLRASEPAVVALPDENLPASFRHGYVRSVRVTFRCAPVTVHDDVAFAWETETPRWVGHAQGAVRLEENGGLILEPGITNESTNPVFGYAADPDNGWTSSGASLTASHNTNPDYIWHGYWSQELEEDGTADRQRYQSIDVGDTETHCASIYVKTVDGATPSSSLIQMHHNGADLTTTFEEAENGFYRAYATFTGVASSVNIGVTVKQGKHVYVDGFQVEEGSVPTSLASGDMGRGYVWTGMAHASTTTRAAAGVKFRNAASATVPMMRPHDTGQIMVAWEAWADAGSFPTAPPTSDLSILFDHQCTPTFRGYYNHANDKLVITDGTTYQSTGTLSFSKGDVIFFFFEWGSNGVRCRALDEDGASLGDSGLGTYHLPTSAGVDVWIGSNSVPADHAWYIRQVQIWERTLTEAEQIARAQCGVGNAELPILWSVNGDGTLVNHDDAGAGHDCWCEISNAPGDFDAALTFMVTNTQATAYRYAYISQARGIVPRSDLPSRKHLVGSPFRPCLEAEAGSSSYDGNTTSQADAAASGGTVARTVPSNTSDVKRIDVPVALEPEDVWKYAGRWHVMCRMKTGDTDHFDASFRVETGETHHGPTTVQVTLDAQGTGRPLVPNKLVVDIPGVGLSPKDLQQFRPGDFSGGTYCLIEYWLQAAAATGTANFDYLMLMQAGNSGMATIGADTAWSQNRVLVVDTCEGLRSVTVHDIDREELLSGLDWEGTYFTLPPKDPVIMSTVVRASGSAYPWDIADTFTVNAKYKPRYRFVR